MRTSESTATIAKKLVGAQADMKNAQLDGTNPHFGSKYATLAAIREATVPALHAHGIAMVQGTHVTDDGTLVAFTRLSYEDEWYESTYPIVIEKPQQMGSAITYAKRYMLAAMCGIVAEEDDDGNAAQATREHRTDEPFDVDNKLGFGKHGDLTWREVARDQPGYVIWLCDNTDRLAEAQADELLALINEFTAEAREAEPDLDLSDPATEEQVDELKQLYLAMSPGLTDAQRERCRQAMKGTTEQAKVTIEWLTDKANSLAAAGA